MKASAVLMKAYVENAARALFSAVGSGSGDDFKQMMRKYMSVAMSPNSSVVKTNLMMENIWRILVAVGEKHRSDAMQIFIDYITGSCDVAHILAADRSDQIAAKLLSKVNYIVRISYELRKRSEYKYLQELLIGMFRNSSRCDRTRQIGKECSDIMEFGAICLMSMLIYAKNDGGDIVRDIFADYNYEASRNSVRYLDMAYYWELYGRYASQANIEDYYLRINPDADVYGGYVSEYYEAAFLVVYRDVMHVYNVEGDIGVFRPHSEYRTSLCSIRDDINYYSRILNEDPERALSTVFILLDRIESDERRTRWTADYEGLRAFRGDQDEFNAGEFQMFAGYGLQLNKEIELSAMHEAMNESSYINSIIVKNKISSWQGQDDPAVHLLLNRMIKGVVSKMNEESVAKVNVNKLFVDKYELSSLLETGITEDVKIIVATGRAYNELMISPNFKMGHPSDALSDGSISERPIQYLPSQHSAILFLKNERWRMLTLKDLGEGMCVRIRIRLASEPDANEWNIILDANQQALEERYLEFLRRGVFDIVIEGEIQYYVSCASDAVKELYYVNY